MAFVRRLQTFFHYLTNPTVRKQKKDAKTIPIIIINFNQLFYLKQLVDFLIKRSFSNIIIIDNQSSFPPLLAYYKEIENRVTVHYMESNEGHMVFFNNAELFSKYSKGYYVVTDADIVPNPLCPDDFLETMIQWLDKDIYARKVGFALKIDDIPDYYPLKEKVLNWEKRFWADKLAPDIYRADIDTTFALYRPCNRYRYNQFYSGIRIAGTMTATHGGWYLDPENLSAEQQFYRLTANLSSSWNVDGDGRLKGEHINKY